jgi:hypothetical protein
VSTDSAAASLRAELAAAHRKAGPLMDVPDDIRALVRAAKLEQAQCAGCLRDVVAFTKDPAIVFTCSGCNVPDAILVMLDPAPNVGETSIRAEEPNQ